jgi:hypothetical protein
VSTIFEARCSIQLSYGRNVGLRNEFTKMGRGRNGKLWDSTAVATDGALVKAARCLLNRGVRKRVDDWAHPPTYIIGFKDNAIYNPARSTGKERSLDQPAGRALKS